MCDKEFETSCEEQIKQWREQRHREISEIAYRKWQEAGEPQGDGVQFWLDAEKEWDERDYYLPVYHEDNCDKECLPGAQDLGATQANPTDPRTDDPNLPWRERVTRFWARWGSRK